MEKLPCSFFKRNTLIVAQDLLGKYLVRVCNNKLIGKIVETEAYMSSNDPACHAAKKRTSRNEIMYQDAGVLYIYLIYGMYYCLNIVTEEEGKPCAVLIRALEPIEGMQQMMEYRKTQKIKNLTNGPSKLCQALNINKKYNGIDISGDNFYLTNGEVEDFEIVKASRIGIKVGTENLWRFYIKDNPFVSKT
ncbi:MAG: DNA-3-methyladenine glycosylase [bacterium]|nr:DNA-3-methyladenine glycosylase [bacterium]